MVMLPALSRKDVIVVDLVFCGIFRRGVFRNIYDGTDGWIQKDNGPYFS